MSITSIPPFPAQDLAKLVLGYLAEEQLMTAYDEFLQASPYLDAFKNEYDRIFMTSLRNILADYRATKIYVESCKPVALRRRLFGCANLLEVVKFLIQNIDFNKLQPSEPLRTRDSSANTSIASTSILTKLTECDVCNSVSLPSCVCKPATVTSRTAPITSTSSDTSMETTALEDLPGNHCQVKKTQVKLLEKVNKISISSSSENSTDIITASKENLSQRSVCSIDQNASATLMSNTQFKSAQDVSKPHSVQENRSDNLINSTINSKEKIEEFNNILKTVCNSSKVESHCTNISLGNNENSRLSTGFQEFATGVHGNHNAVAKPESSTTQNTTRLTNAKENGSANQAKPLTVKTVQPVTKATILLKVGRIKEVFKNGSQFSHKPAEQKVTILSDIKVDKTYHSDNTKIPPVLKNATSTPVMQTQSILINGTPAYKQDTKNMKLPHPHYTKDEIMAMPTIILVPSSDSSDAAVSQSQPITSMASDVNSSARRLGSLILDIASKNSALKENNPEPQGLPCLDEIDKEPVLNAPPLNSVEMKNASMPKDMTENSNKCTPHSLPPVRKSSSTPRRNSHVRVLDFTTPRRILQDTINEHSSEQNSNDAEIIVSKSPSFNTFVSEMSTENHTNERVNDNTQENSDVVDKVCTKENQDSNKITFTKRHNWDSDLRALALAHQGNVIEESTETPAKRKVKPRAKKKDDVEFIKDRDKTSEKKPKQKTKKKPSKSEKSSKELKDKAIVQKPVPVKPTINIITDWSIPLQEDKEKLNKSVNKSNDDQIDTPEAERLSLQNAIGAKLNISDLLETPYKQALYDIQMETPRFLGPDIPGEPLSDIKIMNIPTPRFLSSPKQAQPTPSSYSSRPTDYSSGGSYYKPEDQDYMRIDDLEYPENKIDNENETTKKVTANEGETKQNNAKSSRPVRKCTKNISYRSSGNKTKELSDKAEVSSETSNRSSLSAKVDKDLEKTAIEEKRKEKKKTEPKKRASLSKKRRTPIKKETKSFIKIKPRRVTPIKDDGRSKHRLSESQTRKRTSSKDKFAHTTPTTFVPTKSRRKSSTPRKLHCTKSFTSESSGHESPEIVKNIKNPEREINVKTIHDSDAEQLPLRWSDDGSQDTKSRETLLERSTNDSEDITKIQEFIAESGSLKLVKERESNLHIDLVKRGFDVETAKIIERDLLDIHPSTKCTTTLKNSDVTEPKLDAKDVSVEKLSQSDTSTSMNLHIDEDKEMSSECEEDEEVELSVHECHEETTNFITFCHDGTSDCHDETSEQSAPLTKLKDKFTMEVCIDDGVAIRLRATPFTILFDQDPKDLETELAVSSISNIDRLYTPMKDAVRAQCYEIFDSTLTSIDTPLKTTSSKRTEREMMVTEIVLEIEKEEDKEIRTEGKKRKRGPSENAPEDSNESKKSKADPQYLLNSASIQNIDIETVLSKLHGP